ncbi:MAG: acyltransferase [Thermoleophilaceae bacterium]
MGPRTLAEAVSSRDNSFDILRFAAATLVLLYHCYALSGGDDPVQPLTGLTLGTLGVLTFFGISGYLVTRSWLHDSRVGPYLIKRGLRLMPGLMVAALLAAFVVGPLMSQLSLSAYLSDPTPYTYVVRQLALITFNPHLPGVFSDNPVPHVVNGSLWTIPLEACCYAAVLVAGLLGVLRRPAVLAALLAVVCVAMLVAAAPDDAHGKAPTGIDIFLSGLRPCGAFLAGALLWVVHERVPRHPALAAAAAALFLIPVSTNVHSAIDIVTVPYLSVLAGSLRPGRLALLTGFGDVSYGVYIYAYPLQQALVDAFPGIVPGALFGASVPAAWFAGLLSWRLVEYPALRLKRRLDSKGRTAPAPAPT